MSNKQYHPNDCAQQVAKIPAWLWHAGQHFIKAGFVRVQPYHEFHQFD